MNIKCPQCRNMYHETTENFNPHVNPRGHMLRLKEPWRKWMWNVFFNSGRPRHIDEGKETLHTQMFCPGCGAALAPSGRLFVVNPDGSRFVPGPAPVPVDNTVDGKLVFDFDYSDLEESTMSIGSSAEEFVAEKTIDLAVTPGVQNLNTETRNEKVLRLRSEGLTFSQIGRAVGLARGTCCQIVKRAGVA